MKNENPPCAVCTVCHQYSYRIESINQQCYKQYDKKRCKGVFSSALANGDWLTCDVCQGTGKDNFEECMACQGTGWSFVRK